MKNRELRFLGEVKTDISLMVNSTMDISIAMWKGIF